MGKKKTDEEVQRVMGCIPSKKDIRDYKLNKKVCHAALLPEEFEVEHSAIKNQGGVGSCVAHSVAEILEELVDNQVKYSTAWIYGYRPYTYFQGVGMMPSQAIKTTKSVGCVQYDDCPGNYEVPKAKEYIDSKLSALKKIASQDKVTSYARLNTVQDIKEAIFKTGKPVLVCILCDNLALDENYIAQLPYGAAGGHAVVCYGWNKFGLLIQNSWGKTWGNKGCFILPYEYPLLESWIITKDKDVVVKPTAFAFREFLVNIGRLISTFFKGLFRKKQ